MSVRANLAWSVRRELWEHRSTYVAPLAIAALIAVGFLFHATKWAEAMTGILALAPQKQLTVVFLPFGLASSVILLTSWLVGFFYCLDALYGERRDRSILFWKSMPVSDVMTVLSKAATALVVVPAIALAAAIATQLLMLLGGTVALAVKGMDPSIPWTTVPWLATTFAMVYGMAAHCLWFAPIVGWLLLVSTWVPRSPFLWAFLPFLAAMAVEKIAVGSSHVFGLIKYRFTGGMTAFKPDAFREPITQFSQLDPAAFLATPGLWLGLVFTAACLAGAIRLRRYREPI